MKRILALTAVGLLAACAGRKEKAPTIQTATVSRRSIVVYAEATGVIEPINIVEVKSKASGLITRMPVETGMLVKSGDLLVQIDTRDVQNQFNQADADARAAQAKLQVSESQKKRSDEMFKARVITAQEHESAQLDFENAKASVVRTAAALDLARQRLEDATVVATVAGTVIEKDVSLGQVITSATNSFGGGTTIIKMADLNMVRVRALFNETDIGQVRAGQVSTVTVDAFPDRRFQGLVEKIEPQAVIQQNVTMFPVLVNLDNREGLLKPGMNGDISVLVDQRDNVIAVPNDALKNPREAAVTASLLGLNVDSVQADVRAQFSATGMGGSGGGGRRNGGGGNGGNGGNGGGNAGGGRSNVSRGDVALLPAAPQTQQQGFPQQGGFQQGPEVTDKDCAGVKAAFARKPAAQQKLDELRTKMRSQEMDFQTARGEMQKIFADVGVDGRIAMACSRRERTAAGAGAGGGFGGGGFGGRGAQGASTGAQSKADQSRRQGTTTAMQPAQEQTERARPRPGLVFVAQGATYKPRVVMLGQSNYDYTEVLSGLKEGEKVAMLASLALQAQRQQMNDRMRQNAGVPGLNTPGAGRGPGGPGGGAPGGGPRGR